MLSSRILSRLITPRRLLFVYLLFDCCFFFSSYNFYFATARKRNDCVRKNEKKTLKVIADHHRNGIHYVVKKIEKIKIKKTNKYILFAWEHRLCATTQPRGNQPHSSSSFVISISTSFYYPPTPFISTCVVPRGATYLRNFPRETYSNYATRRWPTIKNKKC